MAAEALEQAAKDKGHEIEVEVHGAAGADKVSPETIRQADAVIVAADATISERERFSGLPTVEVGLRQAIDRPQEVVERAEKVAAEGRSQPSGEAEASDDDDVVPVGAGGGGWGSEVRRWLMTGVSYMIPFVVAGGILIAISFALGGAVEVTETDVYESFSVPAMLYEIGSLAFSMLVPVLAGFIAYAMADRPGIAPGLVGGLVANEIGAGFLGGIAAGLLGGAAVILLKRIPIPGNLARLMPVLVYPLVGSLIVGAMMILVVGEPIAALTTGLENWLASLEGSNAVLLGLILGAMMAFDMGGPVNKVAYAFAIAGLETGAFGPMAAVMAAGMVPPLALALLTAVRPALFTPGERRAGQAGWVMGASFITEGAIPFAAADPLRVIPPLMVASATAASLSLAFGATLQAPHGGIFVVGLIGNWPMYLVAIAAGTLVGALLLGVTKSLGRETATEASSAGETASREAAASA